MKNVIENKMAFPFLYGEDHSSFFRVFLGVNMLKH